MSVFPGSPDLEPVDPSLDHRIETLQQQVEQQKQTIAKLAAEGHEVSDAREHLVGLLQSLQAQIRMKFEGATKSKA